MRAIVDIQQNGIEPALGRRDKVDDIAHLKVNAPVFQRPAAEFPKNGAVPFHPGLQKFAHHHRRNRGTYMEGLALRMAHAQPADEDAGCRVVRQMCTSQSTQFQFGFMLAAVHQVLAVDHDRKIAIMPI